MNRVKTHPPGQGTRGQLTARANRRKQEPGKQIMANRANDNPKDPVQMSLGLVRDTCKKWSQGGRARGPNVIRARRICEHGSGHLAIDRIEREVPAFTSSSM